MDDYTTNDVALRQFDYFHFKVLVTRLFTTTQVPFSLIEEEVFRDLLIYYKPRLHNLVLSRRSLSRYIEYAYE
jgi:hypothetical protein